MRASILFTVASLLLITSYSLPQPENLEASKTIEDREARNGPTFANHREDPEWWENHRAGDGAPASNDTKIKEREEPFHGGPGGRPSKFFEHEHTHGGSGNPGANETKIKERQQPQRGDFTPPDGMTWKQWMKHQRVHNSNSQTNSTKVKMMKFRD